MERMLEKLARQLNGLDEASLFSLWGRYAARVERFEPTQRWEEAALCLCMCQAVRWKNQLFNHHFAASVKPGGKAGKDSAPEMPVPHVVEPLPSDAGKPAKGRSKKAGPPKAGKVLNFPAPISKDGPTA